MSESQVHAQPGEGKRYYARIPNSTIQVMVAPGNALPFSFVNHELHTAEIDPRYKGEVEKYLDAIADVPGSGITVKDQAAVEADVKAIQAQMREEAAIAQTKLVKSGERA